jgi:hypothetical protein
MEGRKKYSNNQSQHLHQSLLKFQQEHPRYPQEVFRQDGPWSSGLITAINTSNERY